MNEEKYCKMFRNLKIRIANKAAKEFLEAGDDCQRQTFLENALKKGLYFDPTLVYEALEGESRISFEQLWRKLVISKPLGPIKAL